MKASQCGLNHLRARVCVVSQVQETKSELSGLADGIEEVRSVCRQLHTHLRQLPGCLSIPFEDETEAVMDRWLDVSHFKLSKNFRFSQNFLLVFTTYYYWFLCQCFYNQTIQDFHFFF